MGDLTKADWDMLIERARAAMASSHSPYSSFRVGAAVLTDKGVYTGANIENASFGLTICAERVALFSALMQEGPEKMRVRAIAITNDKGVPSSPCGACRQVIAEFTPDAKIAFPGAAGFQVVGIDELLSHTFRFKA